MKTRQTAIALVALAMMVSPAAAEEISELEPYLGGNAKISGTPNGNGEYGNVIFGENGEKGQAERLSIKMDGNRLTDLSMENLVIKNEDGSSGTIGRIVVENSAIPLDLDKENPKEFVAWLLTMNADRLAIEDFDMTGKDATVKIDTIAAEGVTDGYFANVRINGFSANGQDDNGTPFVVTMDRLSLRGVGAGWLVYMRLASLDQAASFNLPDQPLTGEDFAFLDDFKLSDHLEHLRLKGFDVEGFEVNANGQQVLDLESYGAKVTSYAGPVPAGYEFEMTGTANVESIRTLSANNPQAQMGLQMFQAAYGDPVVRFSSKGTQVYDETARTHEFSATMLELDRLMKIDFNMGFVGYSAEKVLEAVMDPNDDKTSVSAMKDAVIKSMSLDISDLGALDIGFALAPPGFERNQAAMQAAQFAGLGVVQAMQFGVSITGSVAEIVSGFIKDGGTIGVKLQDGSEIPMEPFMAIALNPEDQGAVMAFMKHIKLEVTGSK